MECPERVSIILAELQSRRLAELCPPSAYGLDSVLAAHDKGYVEFLHSLYDEWRQNGGEGVLNAPRPSGFLRGVEPEDFAERLVYYTFSGDVAIGGRTYAAAREAVDIALTGIECVLGGDGYGLALCRPPGHHAPRDQFGGFCYLNNVCLAAYHALSLGAERAAVVDIDYHHGNGSQSILESEPNIFFASLHADTRFAYPYVLGKADETGLGLAEGTMQNYPMPSGTEDVLWRDALGRALARVQHFGPDVLLISLGVDTFVGDPIADFRLQSEDYFHYGEMIAKLGRPTLFVMEGGYNLDFIGINVANVLEGFLQGRA